MSYCLVLPAYDEEENIGALLDRVEAVVSGNRLALDILVVNDGSHDRTPDVAKEKAREYGNVTLVSHPSNRGFAAALKTGIKYLLENGYNAGVFMDCDQTHDPTDLPEFVQALEDGADFVIGSRYIGQGRMVGVPRHRVFISKAGNFFGRIFFRLPVADASGGYRAISRKGLEGIKLKQNDFSIQLEEVLRGKRLGLIFKEVPIVLTNRKLGKSHFKLGLGVLWKYAALLFRSLAWR